MQDVSVTREPLQIDPETSEKGLSAVFEERLSTIIEALGGASKVAERFGIGRESVWKWRKGKARPSLFNVAEMCAEAGYSIDWLMGLVPPTDDEFVDLKLLEASAEGAVPAKPGGAQSLIAMRHEWFERFGIDEGMAGILTAVGDAMHPTLRDGSVLIIDTAAHELRDGCVFALARGGVAFVRRVQVAGDAVVLIPDNDQYESERLSRSELDELNVIGQVVGAWVNVAPRG